MPIYEREQVQVVERRPYWTLWRIFLLICMTPLALVSFWFLYGFITNIVTVQMP